MSQLLTAAGTLKLWQSRPLVLATVSAWRSDTLHATMLLCWWRWRRQAVARLRFKAALGVHMFRYVLCGCCMALCLLGCAGSVPAWQAVVFVRHFG